MNDEIIKKKKITKEDLKQTFDNLKKSYKFVRSNKRSLLACIIVSILNIPMSIISPILSARILLDLNGELYHDLLRVAAFILVVYTIQHLLGFFTRILYKKYMINVTYGIQKELVEEIFELEVSNFDKHGTGVFTDRLKYDCNMIASIFDEATSALDNETQEKIQTAIHNLKGKYTILIIAHRLSTIVNSDNIIMIDKGKIVATGTHKKLIETSLKYKKLYQAELSSL